MINKIASRHVIIFLILFCCFGYKISNTTRTDIKSDIENLKKEIVNTWGQNCKKTFSSFIILDDSLFKKYLVKKTYFKHFGFFEYTDSIKSQFVFNYIKRTGLAGSKETKQSLNIFDKAGIIYFKHKNMLIVVSKLCRDNLTAETEKEDKFFKKYLSSTKDTTFMRMKCGRFVFEYK